MEKKRSLGITIISCLFIAQGILTFILQIVGYLVAVSYGANSFPLMSLIYIILLFAVAFGLLSLKPWAKNFTLFIIVPFIHYSFTLPGICYLEGIKYAKDWFCDIA